MARDFSQYLVDPTESGPEATFGTRTIRFKKKQPLSAIVSLVDESATTSPIDRSKDYLRGAVLASDASMLEDVFNEVEATGLSALVEWLTSEYTTFPTETLSV